MAVGPEFVSFVYSTGTCTTSQRPPRPQQHSAKMSVMKLFLKSPHATVTLRASMTYWGRKMFLFLSLFKVRWYALRTISLGYIVDQHRIADPPHLRYHTFLLDLSNLGGLPQEARHLIPAEIISPSRNKIRRPSLRKRLILQPLESLTPSISTFLLDLGSLESMVTEVVPTVSEPIASRVKHPPPRTTFPTYAYYI